jgi:hypothetical protein
MKWSHRYFLVFLLSTFLSTLLAAQQSTPPTAPEPQSSSSAPPSADSNSSNAPAATPAQKDSQSDTKQGKNAGTSNDRLFLALPNFLTLENAGNVPPLTAGQKFRVVARGSFDKIQFFWYGFLAGISQAQDSEPGYGQGAEGYGKRYASAFADGAIENFMTGAVFPSILRQDPRFFQQSSGSFMHRTEYAASRIFVTRTDSGKRQFNYSEIVGSALSAAISTNAYHPRAFVTKKFDTTTDTIVYVHHDSDRTLPNTLSVWGSQIGYDTLTLVIKEFWPDIHRKMNHKHATEIPAAAKSNQ